MTAFKVLAAEGSFVQYSRQDERSEGFGKMQIAKEKLLCPRGGDHPLQDVEHFFVRLQGLHLIYGSLL